MTTAAHAAGALYITDNATIEDAITVCCAAYGIGASRVSSFSALAEAVDVVLLDGAVCIEAATQGLQPAGRAVVVTVNTPSAQVYSAALRLGVDAVCAVGQGTEELIAALADGESLRNHNVTCVRDAHPGATGAGVAASLARCNEATLVDADAREAAMSCALWPYLPPGASWTQAQEAVASALVSEHLPKLAGVRVVAFSPDAGSGAPATEVLTGLLRCAPRSVVHHGTSSLADVEGSARVVVCHNTIQAVHQARRAQRGVRSRELLVVAEVPGGEVAAADVAATLGADAWAVFPHVASAAHALCAPLPRAVRRAARKVLERTTA